MPEKNEKQLESMESVQWVKRYKNYGGKNWWKRRVLFLEWKKEGVMDGNLHILIIITTKSSSGYEIANVNCFTTTSYTY